MIPRSFSQENRPSWDGHDLETCAGIKHFVAIYHQRDTDEAFTHARRLTDELDAKYPEYSFYVEMIPLTWDAELCYGASIVGRTDYKLELSWHKRVMPRTEKEMLLAEEAIYRQNPVYDWRWRHAHNVWQFGP